VELKLIHFRGTTKHPLLQIRIAHAYGVNVLLISCNSSEIWSFSKTRKSL